ncbi:amidohydrolase family protein [Oceanicoccus sp. KOV_DT_Chl]|uniref:amidohydrolase family protein n=1 Tax=Oceanicoccus sp. KOV_DT_Chl TaxID=1904639 RepID=UPI000C7CE421|nr:amidohydrolase family protein [Oceanicoccus sp. KOV_DT_Chl]
MGELYARDDWSNGYFFDQEEVEKFTQMAGEEGNAKFQQGALNESKELSDEQLMAMLSDESSPFAPRRGEFDAAVRLQELEDDGLAGEVIFPQMAPFGAGLMQYRYAVTDEQSLQGIRAYNRWLADFCKVNPGRHAGVALIDVNDIAVTVQEIREARKAGLFGGVLLPTSTGQHPYYHHPRYEPIWAVCEELAMPIHTHSGWSPDYGDVPAATPMYITEVDMWARRPFAAMVWSGAFERHPHLKLIFTEAGCAWISESLRWLEHKAQNPLFAYFKKGLNLTPTEYFQRNCFMGASFIGPLEMEERYKIGVDKIMWGSDYPHMEGTWPNTMTALQQSFGTVPELEVRSMLGEKAAEVFGFDLSQLRSVADRVGPELSQIQTAVAAD